MDMCRFILRLMALFVFLACTEPGWAITNGARMTAEQFEMPGPHRAVVGFFISHLKTSPPYGSAGLDSFCTGVVLNENTILSAAHCFVKTRIGGLRTRISVFYGPEAEIGPKLYSAVISLSDVQLHPEYKPDLDENLEVNQLNDLAIIKLKSPLKNSTPVVLPFESLEILNSQSMTILGYGTRELNYSTPMDLNAWGHLNIAETHFSDQDSTTRTLTIDQTAAPGICKGDSGAPAIFRSGEGNEYLLIGLARQIGIDKTKLTEAEHEEINKKGMLRFMKSHPTFDVCKGLGMYLDIRPHLAWIKAQMH